jgi:hypothetical protein
VEQSATVGDPSATISRAGLRRASPLLLLCGLVALAYGPAVPNFFVSDDLDMLSGDASDLFSPASGFGRFMPLAASIHRTTSVLFGLNPVPAHALQLALHVASALLVYALVRQLVLGPGRRDADASNRGVTAQAAVPARGGDGAMAVALVAALLFALYPRHHQVVMWFGAVSIGVAAMLALATAVLFVRAWRYRDARAGWAAAATYTAALLAHESAVVLPLLLAALALHDRTLSDGARGRGAIDCARAPAGAPQAGDPSQRGDGVRAAGVINHAPAPRGYGWSQCVVAHVRALPAWVWTMLLASAVHLGLLMWAYRVRAATYPDSGYRFLGLGGDLAAAPLRYAAQLVVPPPWTESLALGGVGLVVGGLALLGAVWWALQGGAVARLGLAWAAVAGAPFVLFGIYGVTDRYFYLPSVGLALALAAALARTGRWRVPLVAAYTVLGVVLLGQVAGEWRLAGASVRVTMAYLEDWAGQSRAAPPEAAAFVGVPFKRGEQWPGSQVYVFSTGLVGAAHLATGWPALRVSYVFADEQPALGAWLDGLPEAAGPPGLALFALDVVPPANRTAVLGGALPELAGQRWRGASRTPIDWAQYGRGNSTGE